MSAQREWGVVVIGAGDMGARHARAWSGAGARVRAVVDPDAARAEAVAAVVGASAAANPGAALAREDVQMVSVCTPTFLHARYAVAALEAGKHVLCEKPVALHLADAEAIRRAAQRAGRLVRIGFIRRFDPVSRRVRALAPGLGAPLMVQASLGAGVRPKRMMHDADANGGPIVDMCCHLFDEWRHLFGAEAESVRARGHVFGASRPELAGIANKAVDSAHIALSYPGGGMAQIQVSWGMPAGIPPFERHTYVGPEGVFGIDWPTGMTVLEPDGPHPWEAHRMDPWEAEIAAFRRELEGDAEDPPATLEDGIAALRTSVAALRSIAEGREVRLADVVDDGVADRGSRDDGSRDEGQDGRA